jgi:hypothetical protein
MSAPKRRRATHSWAVVASATTADGPPIRRCSAGRPGIRAEMATSAAPVRAVGPQ